MSARRRRSAAVVSVLGSLLLVPPLSGQRLELPEGLSEATSAALDAEIAAVEAEGLPSRPLVLKSLEGRSKGASEQQVLDAVRALRSRLEAAAAEIGGDRSETVLVAAAGALYVGVDRETLRAMAEESSEEALGMALVVLGDLVQRGVPVGTASRAVVSLSSAGVDATTLSDFRRRVDDDIRTGVAPGRATELRLRGVLTALGGPPGT